MSTSQKHITFLETNCYIQWNVWAVVLWCYLPLQPCMEWQRVLAIVTAIIGVRQGSPTLYILFNLFVDTLITIFKERRWSDCFFNWLHILMLMDDTVILTTSKNKLEKLTILYDYFDTHGMVVNAHKTRFIVINADDQDKTPIRLRENVIRHCDQYVYLGSVFTSDGSTKSSIEQHVKEKEKHFHKLVMFLCTNRELPFCVKRNVVETAFNAIFTFAKVGLTQVVKLQINCT